jgi:hypothetical protein
MREEVSHLTWPNAVRVVKRNATILKSIFLVAFVCLAIVFSTLGIYLRSWRLNFKIQELKDFVLIGNYPDTACEGTTDGEWVYAKLENFRGCEARQRLDFTLSDKELYDQCVSTHNYEREKYCNRGREVHIHVFNITNPRDVVDGLTPRIVEVGRAKGGPFVFYEDCKTFNTEFGKTDVEYNEYCYYTYKYASTEAQDLRQQIVTVNSGLLEAIGNSIQNIDYIVPVVWGTLALDVMNTTTTTAEDYIRGQLLSFSWPNNFGAMFLNHFSQAPGKAGFRARDNAKELFEMILDPLRQECIVNGTTYDRNQCISMANTLAIYAKRYYESFQTYIIDPYGLTYKEGAGLFVKAYIGDLLGYYEGYDDPLSAYMFPKKISWNVVRSHTQVEVAAAVRAGMADAQNGILTAGPMGRSKVVTNTIDDLGGYKMYDGRTYITEFDFPGCRPLAKNGQVVVPRDGPYPPPCNGGTPQAVYGSRGMQFKPRAWNLQPGIDAEGSLNIFSKTLMRPLQFTKVEDLELEIDENDFVNAIRFELKEDGLNAARMAFNCAPVYKQMAEAGVLNRGSDCDIHNGMFDLSARYHNIPYAWSLPHFYLVTSNDSNQHPRNNLLGFVTPTGPRYRNMVVIEYESGRVLQSMYKEQISIRLPKTSGNYFFTKHKQVILPLYWIHNTKNVTTMEKALWGGFQGSFLGLNAGFIVLTILAILNLIAALLCGMFLYRQSSLQTVEEKRKKIRAELEAAMPARQKNKADEQDDAESDEAEFM